jgi:hypothetical protein
MKDEGGRMKDEVKAGLLFFILHPSAFILHQCAADDLSSARESHSSARRSDTAGRRLLASGSCCRLRVRLDGFGAGR